MMQIVDASTNVAPTERTSKRARAQLGNLNRATSAARSYWRRRALKPEDRWVLKLVETYLPDLLGDKPDATAAEQRLAELAGAARVCWLLALAHHDDAATARYMAVETRCLKTLGLSRRAKPAPGLRELLAARTGEDQGQP